MVSISDRASSAVKHRRLADLHDVLRSAHGAGRIERHDLANHQPVEQHPNGRQVLFDRGRRIGLCQQLHVGGHHHRLDAVKPLAVHLAPVGEPETGNQIRLPGIRVADRGGEELPEALFGVG